jgi:hypothetical protein
MTACSSRCCCCRPRAATNLGLDTGARAGLKSRLADRAVTGRTGWWGPLIEALPRLRAIDAASLPLRERALRDTAIWFGERARESRAIPYGAGQTPYVLTQLYGSSISLPNFLDTEHKIETTADAQAYLDRLDAYHRNVDAEVAMAREDAAAGMVPPGFILDKALAQTRTALGQRGAQADLVRSLVRRTREKNLPATGKPAQRAASTGRSPPRSAGRRRCWPSFARARATTAGIGARPQGTRILRQCPALLHKHRSRRRSGPPARAWRSGAADREADRCCARRASPRADRAAHRRAREAAGQLSPRTMRAAGAARLYRRMDREAAPCACRSSSIRLPTSPMEGAPRAGGDRGRLGRRLRAVDRHRRHAPGIFYINLQDVSARPRFGLPTLTAHEAVPGHLWQGAIVNSARTFRCSTAPPASPPSRRLGSLCRDAG